MMNYTDFERASTAAFIPIQELFLEKYAINDWPHWYYDDTTSLLTLSTDDGQVNFRYITLGTFSNKTETWMWSWNQADYVDTTADKLLDLKALGIASSYSKLYTPLFASDIYDGWSFLAIAQKILGGLGGYRVQTEHYFKYMLIMEHIDRSEADVIKASFVDCETHGSARMAFVCKHLSEAGGKGFHEAFETQLGMELDEEEFQAWCDDCEIARIGTNGWTDESMEVAQIKLICERCYFSFKSANTFA